MRSLSIPLRFATASKASSGRLLDIDAQTIAALLDGPACQVQSVKSPYSWDSLSTATADGINVVQPTVVLAAGRFIRNPQPTNYLTQATWVIDPAGTLGTSSDENDGLTNATALRTYAEFSRRLGWPSVTYPAVSMTVTVREGTAPATDPLNLRLMLGPGINFTMNGTATVTRTSTLTGVTALNSATPQSLEVTDGAFVWTPNLGQLFSDTTAPRTGARAWVAKNVGAGVGRLSNLVTPPAAEFGVPTVVVPVNGDGYTLSTLSTCSIGYVSVDCANASTPGNTTGLFQNMQWNGTGSGVKGIVASSSVTVSQFNNVFFNGLALQGIGTGAVNTCNCQFTSCFAVGLVALAGMTNAPMLLNAGANASFFDYNFLGQGGAFTFSAGAFAQVGNVQIWDAAATGNACRLEGRSCLYSRAYLQGGTLLWGTNNAGFGTFVESGSDLIYVTKPTLNTLGVGREASIGGVSTLWAAVPAVTAANNAAIVARA